jgi:hypothetical protein
MGVQNGKATSKEVHGRVQGRDREVDPGERANGGFRGPGARFDGDGSPQLGEGGRSVGIRSKKIDIDAEEIEPEWCEDGFYRISYNILNAAISAFERYVIRALGAVKDDPRLKNEPRLRELIHVLIRQEADPVLEARQRIPEIVWKDAGAADQMDQWVTETQTAWASRGSEPRRAPSSAETTTGPRGRSRLAGRGVGTRKWRRGQRK